MQQKVTGQDAENTNGPDAPRPETERRDPQAAPKEIGGPSGPEPTRFGDWERRGRCIDF